MKTPRSESVYLRLRYALAAIPLAIMVSQLPATAQQPMNLTAVEMPAAPTNPAARLLAMRIGVELKPFTVRANWNYTWIGTLAYTFNQISLAPEHAELLLAFHNASSQPHVYPRWYGYLHGKDLQTASVILNLCAQNNVFAPLEDDEVPHYLRCHTVQSRTTGQTVMRLQMVSISGVERYYYPKTVAQPTSAAR